MTDPVEWMLVNGEGKAHAVPVGQHHALCGASPRTDETWRPKGTSIKIVCGACTGNVKRNPGFARSWDDAPRAQEDI